MKNTIDPVLEKVKRAVLGYDKNADVILFGSRARGDERKDSDWDFLILTSFQINEKKKREIRDQLFYVELETEQTISTIIHSKESWAQLKVVPLYQYISKEGKQL